MTALSTSAAPPRPWKRLGHTLAITLGVAALVHVVMSVGATRLLGILTDVGALAVVLVAFELLVFALETAAAHTLAGTRAASSVRGALASYAAAHLLPGGRVAGEIARLGHTRSEVGTMRAAQASFVLHAAHVGSVVLTLVAVALVIEGQSATLAATLAGVAAWNLGITVFLVAAPRSARGVAALGARFGLDASSLTTGPRLTLDAHARAAGLVLLARGAHVIQAMAAVALVTRRLDARGGLAAEGLQLLAGAIGDAVPGQAGVLEGAFQTFGALVVSGDVAAAVGVAVLLRAVRLAMLGPALLAYLGLRSR